MPLPVTADLLLSALGKGDQDKALVASFADATLNNWIDAEEYEDEPLVIEYWRFGCALTFDETAKYSLLYGLTGLQGNYAITSVLFYAEQVNGFRRFEGELPFGLAFPMAPDKVTQILGIPLASRIPYDRRVDLFLKDEYVINVCFSEDLGHIDFIEVRLRNIYERGVAPHDPSLTWEAICQPIGHLVNDPSMLSSISSTLKVPVLGEELAEFECDVYRRSLGLTFYSQSIKKLYWPELEKQYGNPRQRVVTGVKFGRAGDFGSRGYKGTLPFNLQFADDPQTLLKKLPVAPSEQSESEGGGHYGFVFENRYFHIQYSLVFWQTIAVSVFHLALTPEHMDRTPDE